MDEADTLYGVTMQEEDISKLPELKTAEMAKKRGLDNILYNPELTVRKDNNQFYCPSYGIRK